MKFMRNKHKSLSSQYSFTTIIVVALVLLVFGGIAVFYSSVNVEEKLTALKERVSGIAAISTKSALWNLERDSLKDIGKALFKEKGFVFFQIVDDIKGEGKGRTIHQKTAPEYTGKSFDYFEKSTQFIALSTPIYHQGKYIGTVQLAISTAAYYREWEVTVYSIIVLAMLIIIAISLTSIYITKSHIFQPLLKLEKSAAKIADGDLESDIDTSGKNEIGSLARAFGSMKLSVKELIEKLEKSNKELEESNRTLEENVATRTAELHQSKQKLEAVLGNIHRRIYWKNLDGKIEGGNRVLARDLGLSKPEKLKEKTELEILKKKKLFEKISEITKKARNRKGKLEPEEISFDDAGKKKWYKINCRPLKDPAGNPTSILVAFRDITTEKHANQRLEKAKNDAERAREDAEIAREEAVRANRTKDLFLANVSHEIRTPLNSIVGFTELVLLSEELPPKQSQQLMKVTASSFYLKRIINDILDYSRIESGELNIGHEPFHLDDILQDVMDNFKSRAKSKGILLELDKKKGVPVSLVGDDLRLKQVLNNLVNNGIKFTDKGSVKIKVSCSKRDKKTAKLLFSISDTGCGISKEDLDKIYLPFQQLVILNDGVGLGMSISKQLLDLMAGTIKVQSEPGEGTTFNVTIPFQRSGEKIERRRTEHVTDGSRAKYLGALNLTVLAVEDNKSSQALMKDMMALAGIKVDIVGNGIEALQKIKDGNYDVVLLDLKIPGIDGYEVADTVRKDPKLNKLPIIAVTANAMVGEREKCRAAGIDYLSKPIKFDRLLEKIIKWVPDSKKQGALKDIISQFSDVEQPVATELIDALEGVDVKTALRQYKISFQSYMNNLVTFAQNHADTIEKVKTALYEKETESALNLLHKLKGAAANVEAFDVNEASAKLEEAVQKENLEPLINSLEIAHKQVLTSISTANQRFKEAELVTEKKSAIEISEIKPKMVELAQLLEDNEYEAKQATREIMPHIEHYISKEETTQLMDLVTTNNFRGAHKRLRTIADSIGISIPEEKNDQ